MACTAISTTTLRASLLPFAPPPGRRPPSRHATTTTTTTTTRAPNTRRGLRLPPLLLRASTTGGADSADTDGDREARVLEVTTTEELEELVSASAAGGKLAVLEVRREKSPASEDFAPKFISMAADFAHQAVFAKLLCDKSEAAKLAASSLMVEEVPAFFIWKDGKMVIEYSGTSHDALHHAVARCLGVIEDVG